MYHPKCKKDINFSGYSKFKINMKTQNLKSLYAPDENRNMFINTLVTDKWIFGDDKIKAILLH